MRLIIGGAVVVVACACVFAQDEAAAPAKRDYNAARAALVASVVPASERAEQGWESLDAAIRTVSLSSKRITEALRLRYELGDDTPIDLDPIILIGAPEEEADAGAPAPGENKEGAAPGEGGGEKPEGGAPKGDQDGGEGAAPVDMQKIALSGVRTLMRTYEGNHIFDRMMALRVQPQVYIPLDDKPLMVRDFSYAGGVRTLARLETVRMWRFLEQGEDQKAADSFESLLALGVVMSREPTIMGRLQSIAVIGTATQTLERWMLDHRLDGNMARDLLLRLERQGARVTPMTYTLEGERLTGLDTIARVFDRQIPAPMVMPRGEAGALKSQEECEKDLNELYDAMMAWTKAPVHERREIDPSPAQLAAKMPAGLVLVKIVAPGLEQGVWLSEMGRVDLDGARLMLALEAERAAAGRYPESLDVLVPTVLKELPRDGYAPDGRYRYRRVEGGGTRAGKAYVLYSVGFDGEDNGGKGPAEAEAVMALHPGEKGEGADYVVNRPVAE